MSDPPEDRPPVAPDELSDDDIVAQQSAAHAPQPRVKVEVASQTIVIQQDVEAESQRELSPYTTASDPTIVRDRREVAASLEPVAGVRPPLNTASIALWIGLGALAFGIGGAVALFGGKKAPHASASAQAAAPLGAVVAAPRPKPLPAPPANSAPKAQAPEAPATSTPEAPAVSPSELPSAPVAKAHRPPPPRPKRAHAAPHAKSAPAKPHPTKKPGNLGIPSSI